MNQFESSGTALVGIGCLVGAVATIQDVRVAVLASVITIVVGATVALWGRYG